MEPDVGRDALARPLRILCLVRSLTIGGAETQLVTTAVGLRSRGHDVRIAVFYGVEGLLARNAAAGDVMVIDLRKRGRWDTVGFMRRLCAVMKEQRTEVVYSYLPTANVVSALVAARCGEVTVVWGIRSTDAGGASYDWLGHVTAGCERLLASHAAAIIVNSWRGIEHHARRGFPRDRMRLVRNGVDTARFRFDARARARLRSSLGIGDGIPLVLLAGRHDPMKGIERFLEALRTVHARAVIIGTWNKPYTTRLMRRADDLGVGDRVQWLDRQDDMTGWMSAADVVCSASTHGEGTSNVLIEATACNALTVATNVGDAAEIVGDPLRVARPDDTDGLARALQVAIAAVPGRDRLAAPPALLRNYSLPGMIETTESILAAAVAGRTGRLPGR